MADMALSRARGGWLDAEAKATKRSNSADKRPWGWSVNEVVVSYGLA